MEISHRSGRPFIVKDLQASITYYCERLGFQLDFQGPDEGPFWAGVSHAHDFVSRVAQSRVEPSSSPEARAPLLVR